MDLDRETRKDGKMIADIRHDDFTIEEIQQELQERPEVLNFMKLCAELSHDGRMELLEYALKLKESRGIRHAHT